MKRESVCKGGGTMMPDRPIDLWTIQDHLARYAFAAEFAKDKIILDVACGSGYGSAHLFQRGARMVVGGDIFIPAIEAARKVHIKPVVEFLVLDATSLPFADNSFEVVVSMETIEHLEQCRDYLRECHRVLKSGGIFICSTPNKWHDLPITYGPDHVHEFTVVEFQALIQQFFTKPSFYAQGYFTEAQKIKQRRALRRVKLRGTVEALRSHAPGIYRLLSFTYRKISAPGLSCLRISEITDSEKILSEMGDEHRITPIGSGSLTPRTIIAVARK